MMKENQNTGQNIYIAKQADANGHVAYTPEENAVWQTLIERQLPIVKKYACDEYLSGLEKLALPHDRVPQCHEITATLEALTGWGVEPVPALISFERFFWLLANKRFPAATFIRRREELDYLQEPDIFHEIFGHCPLLTLPNYAAFMQHYGQIGLAATPKERTLLARLFWFTIEFGLIQTPNGLRAYGGGILSSISETIYAITSEIPERKLFSVMDTLRTPYRIDIIQPLYFILNDFNTLYRLVDLDLMQWVRDAMRENEPGPTSAC